jgi:hypothetical protein
VTRQWGSHGRPDPTPPSRELAVCALLGGLAVLALIPLATQGVLVFARTGDFAWPADPVAALIGVVHGEYGTGLPPRAARHLPDAQTLTVLILLAEVLTLAALVLAVRLAVRRGVATLGAAAPGSGLGTVRDARDALGEGVLRRRARVVRPDLPRSILRGRRERRW